MAGVGFTAGAKFAAQNKHLHMKAGFHRRVRCSGHTWSGLLTLIGSDEEEDLILTSAAAEFLWVSPL